MESFSRIFALLFVSAWVFWILWLAFVGLSNSLRKRKEKQKRQKLREDRRRREPEQRANELWPGEYDNRFYRLDDYPQVKTPDWNQRVEHVRRRYNFTCQACACEPPSVFLDTHHMVPPAQGGNHSVDNLITLCIGCHSYQGGKHAQLRDTPRYQAFLAWKKGQTSQYIYWLQQDRDYHRTFIQEVIPSGSNGGKQEEIFAYIIPWKQNAVSLFSPEPLPFACFRIMGSENPAYRRYHDYEFSNVGEKPTGFYAIYSPVIEEEITPLVRDDQNCDSG